MVWVGESWAKEKKIAAAAVACWAGSEPVRQLGGQTVRQAGSHFFWIRVTAAPRWHLGERVGHRGTDSQSVSQSDGGESASFGLQSKASSRVFLPPTASQSQAAQINVEPQLADQW